MGVIGAGSIFIFGALKITGPSAIFFVLVFAMTMLYVCETMATAANRKQSPSIKNVPEIEEFPSIQNEIITLQKSLQIDARVSQLNYTAL
ncbi:hypothetical protein ABES02_04490 [Neobacillus pocheonensis]|uniref:hypothetical protein n=1 Tax=Neobacillus pocheonensis TaxID=363869 RepID=UPI003D28275A